MSKEIRLVTCNEGRTVIDGYNSICCTLNSSQGTYICNVYTVTRIMVTIKKRAGVIPYICSSSIALLSSLLSCSFYLLDLRTISSMDIIEMT